MVTTITTTLPMTMMVMMMMMMMMMMMITGCITVNYLRQGRMFCFHRRIVSFLLLAGLSQNHSTDFHKIRMKGSTWTMEKNRFCWKSASHYILVRVMVEWEHRHIHSHIHVGGYCVNGRLLNTQCLTKNIRYLIFYNSKKPELVFIFYCLQYPDNTSF